MTESIQEEVKAHRQRFDSSIDRSEIEPCLCRYKPSPVVVWLFDALIFVMLSTVLLLVATSVVRGDQEITVKPGRLKKIETKLDGKKILWRPVGDSYDLIEDSSGKSAIGLFPIPGKYQILVVTAKADEPLTETITVTVEGVPPPIPPGPGPTPPGPVDDLAVKTGTAWQMEFDPNKTTHAKALAALYRYGRARMEDSATWGEVFDRMATQATATGCTDKLVNVQRAIQPALEAAIPTVRAARVDAENKAKAAPLFDRVATILEGLK